ncbi:MAG: hypothetical protein H8F28_07005, partial [Fibrella sp.]|nr:hypothetical protein [Armatimonadota bacterium]
KSCRWENRDIYFLSNSNELIEHNMMLIGMLGEAFTDIVSVEQFHDAAITLWKTNGETLPSAEVRAEFPPRETPR